MKYKVDGITYLTLEDVVCCVRAEVRKAKREGKIEFTIEIDSFEKG